MNPEAPTIRVLLVEDNPADARLLQEEFKTIRQPAIELNRVGLLGDALQHARAAKVDVVLLDLALPDSMGLETFTRLQQAIPHVPVIILSGLADEELALQSVNAGAQDYLVKGSVGGELLVRAIRYAIERKRTEEELRCRNQQLQEDLNTASEFQRAFLPQAYPRFPSTATPDESALRFAHLYRPSGSVGGDYFEILQLGDDRAGIFLCDVMGHGVRAAFITAMIRGLVQELKPLGMEPSRFLGQLNASLAEVLRQADTTMFVTAVYVLIDLTAGSLEIANAGHPCPFWLGGHPANVEKLVAPAAESSAVLGLFPDSVYQTTTRPLAPGDRLLLYTDGLFEVAGPRGEPFGRTRLLESVRRHAAQPSVDLMESVIQEVGHYAAGAGFEDDLCLLAVERAGNGDHP